MLTILNDLFKIQDWKLPSLHLLEFCDNDFKFVGSKRGKGCFVNTIMYCNISRFVKSLKIHSFPNLELC